MSAWEITGLILAVLPLVLQGLDAYPDSSLVKFAKANQERLELVEQLKSVQTHLRYTMEQLFARIEAELTVNQWEAFQSPDVKGSTFFDMWNEILKMNPNLMSANIFVDMKDVLDDMVEVLNKVLEHTAIPLDPGSQVLNGIIQNHKKDKTFSITKDFFRRFMFVRRSQRRGRLIERINRNIALLNELSKEYVLMKPIVSTRNVEEELKSHSRFLDRIHSYCDNLYHALFNSWKCDCHKEASAMLRLEKRRNLETKQSSLLRFSLFLTFEHYSLVKGQSVWGFQETEICIDERSSKKKTVTIQGYAEEVKKKPIRYECLQHIKEICESLRVCSLHDTNDLLFFILDHNQKLWAYDPEDRNAGVEIARNCISLETLLSQTRLRPHQSLHLAANIASSLLQLYATPWLPENWCENSIYFPLNIFPVDIKRPYVIVKLGTSPESPQPEAQDDILNPYTVALGIILLELSEGKSLLQWISERTDINIQADDVKNKASLAWKWLTEDAKLKLGGEPYSTVVKRCLQCSFTSAQPQSQRSLSNETFRDAVYRDVVHQLEDIYEMVTTPIGI